MILVRMMEDSRRRDIQRDAVMERFLTQFSMNLGPGHTNNNMTIVSGAPQNYQVMPDLSKNIQYFTGNESSSEAKDWLKNIESMCLLHHWPDNFALETARMHL